MLSSISSLFVATLLGSALAADVHAPTAAGATPIPALGSIVRAPTTTGYFTITLANGNDISKQSPGTQYLANYLDRFGQLSFTTDFASRLQATVIAAGTNSVGQTLYNVRAPFAPPAAGCPNANYTNVVVNSYGHMAAGYSSVVNTAPASGKNSDLTKPVNSNTESGVFVLSNDDKLTVVYQDFKVQDHAALFCLVNNPGIGAYTLTLSDADQNGFAPCADQSLNVTYVPSK